MPIIALLEKAKKNIFRMIPNPEIAKYTYLVEISDKFRTPNECLLIAEEIIKHFEGRVYNLMMQINLTVRKPCPVIQFDDVDDLMELISIETRNGELQGCHLEFHQYSDESFKKSGIRGWMVFT